jgi:hypothetical protein
MPRNQHRETIEDLVCPNDQPRGRRAVEVLIDAEFAAEDWTGRLRLVCAEHGEHSTGQDSTPSDALAEAPNASLEPRDEEEEEERAALWRRLASCFARRVIGPPV